VTELMGGNATGRRLLQSACPPRKAPPRRDHGLTVKLTGKAGGNIAATPA